MGMDAAALQRRLEEVLPSEQIGVEPRVLQSNSEDYAWFSNVLDEVLDGCRADAVAWPHDEQQLSGLLAAAYDLRVPVTIRGGGTGNYGQCVPLKGGLVINTMRMNRVLEVGGGYARVQAGVKLVDLDRAAQPTGQEIRIYPSTYLTATVAGFVCGGSGGIGSISHGMLVDGNVLAATVYPVDADPQPHTVGGAGLLLYIHAFGTTGVLSDVTVPLAPLRTWEQAVLSFPDLLRCHAFCMDLLDDPSVDKRLLSTVEPGVVRYFSRARVPFAADRTSALLMVGEGQVDRVAALAARHGGTLDTHLPRDTKVRLSDFTWNHTTAWAKKADPSVTYLQAMFDAKRFEEQIRAIKSAYGDEFQMHGEYARWGGGPFVGSLPLVQYRGREHLSAMIEFMEGIGVSIANPHTYVLEEGSRTDNSAALAVEKRRNDPAGLLNPGKLAAAGRRDGEQPALAKESSMGLARVRRSLSDLNV